MTKQKKRSKTPLFFPAILLTQKLLLEKKEGGEIIPL
jgi:hypothetical protein